MRAIEILKEDYKTAKSKFLSQGGQAEQVDSAIKAYKELLQKNQITDKDKKQIDWWGKQGWTKFKEFIDGFSGYVTTTQVKKRKLVGKSIILREDDKWLIVIPLDKDASCFHGKNSDWCTTKPMDEYFEQYFYDDGVTLIYCLSKIDGGMWAIAAHENGDMALFDKNDKKLTPEQFFNKTGLDPAKLVSQAEESHGDKISAARADPRKIISAWFNGESSSRSQEVERAIISTRTATNAINYILRVGTPHVWPEKLLAVAFSLTVEPNEPDDVDENPDWDDDRQTQLMKMGKHYPKILDLSIDTSDTIKKMAIRWRYDMIKMLPDASQELNILAVKRSSGNLFKWMLEHDRLNSDSILDILRWGPSLIRLIPNQTEEQQLVAVKNAGYNASSTIFGYLQDPSIDVQMAGVEKEPGSIHHMKNLDKSVKLKAIEKDPLLISRFKNPDEDLQLAAVKRNWIASQYIVDENGRHMDLSEPVQMAIVEKYFESPNEYDVLHPVDRILGYLLRNNEVYPRVRQRAEQLLAAEKEKASAKK
jgi:hypothetical protein